jgi:glutamine cyclotransferase
LYGKSKVLRYSHSGNDIAAQMQLPHDFFAEGLTLFDNKLYLLSWKEGKLLVLHPESLKRLKSFNYEGEGWGLTHNNTQLIMSDGSSTIRFRSPKTFAVEKSISVHSGSKTWDRINELEYIDGIIWANQWQENVLLGIDENSGEVLAVVDISTLQHNAKTQRDSIPNGIAYDEEQQGFWITGKYWRYRYLIKLIPPKS